MAEEDDPKFDRPSAVADQASSSASLTGINAPPSDLPKLGRTSSTSPPAVHPRATEVSAKQTTLDSQPMTATTSASSLPHDHTTKEATDANGASPYGTRSRNRTGSSRPNYTEEPEIMEYEWTSSKKSPGFPDVANSISQASAHLDKSSGANTRRSSNAVPTPPTNIPRATIANTANHQIPGMSSFSVNPDSAAAPGGTTRKRKAPGGIPATQQNSSILTHLSASGPLRRQVSGTDFQTMRTTTLMTFDACQGYLRDGKLQSDDGTWLAVGGKSLVV